MYFEFIIPLYTKAVTCQERNPSDISYTCQAHPKHNPSRAQDVFGMIMDSVAPERGETGG